MKLNMNIKGIAIALLLILMTTAIVVLSVKPCDCTAEMQAAYTGGSSDGLTMLIQGIEKEGYVVIGMPDNQSYAVTNPKYCQALINAATN